MHAVKSDFIGNVCSTKIICFQMLTLNQQCIFLFAYIYVFKTPTSYAMHAFG